MAFGLVDELIAALGKVAFAGSGPFEGKLPGVLDDFIP
jgi:hypothetical protein